MNWYKQSQEVGSKPFWCSKEELNFAIHDSWDTIRDFWNSSDNYYVTPSGGYRFHNSMVGDTIYKAVLAEKLNKLGLDKYVEPFYMEKLDNREDTDSISNKIFDYSGVFKKMGYSEDQSQQIHNMLLRLNHGKSGGKIDADIDTLRSVLNDWNLDKMNEERADGDENELV